MLDRLLMGTSRLSGLAGQRSPGAGALKSLALLRRLLAPLSILAC